MEKLEYIVNQILDCDLCNGVGAQYFSNGEDYDFEDCICNPYGIILDGKDVIFDNGILSENQLFATGEAI
jgi:hypothetical protein